MIKVVENLGYWLELLIQANRKNNHLEVKGAYSNTISCFIEVFNNFLRIFNNILIKEDVEKNFFETCYDNGLIDDIKTWIEMKNTRNILDHHTYEEKEKYYLAFNKISSFIPILKNNYEKILNNYYFNFLKEIKNNINKRLDAEK